MSCQTSAPNSAEFHMGSPPFWIPVGFGEPTVEPHVQTQKPIALASRWVNIALQIVSSCRTTMKPSQGKVMSLYHLVGGFNPLEKY